MSPTEKSRGRVLMVQGTASHVGKSLITAALCRWFADRGVDVAPFKAQNMSLNAGVTPDGAEIGRAQLLQARAARVLPTAAMNPILLKPEAEARSQLIVMGKMQATYSARDYFQQHDRLWPVVTDALETLRDSHELIVAEGAGSPAEINLRDCDLVNMKVARHAEAPVLLVGDIERGGVFAALAGTLQLLEPEERQLVRGMIINKFRGDPTLIGSGPAMLETRTGLPTLGVVPWFSGLLLPEEDALDVAMENGAYVLDVLVVKPPRMSNFDDFDPLRTRPGVRLRFVAQADQWGTPDLVILPGSKSTIGDLAWLRRERLDRRILAHRDAGRPVLGICGGHQMLGRVLRDPDRMESDAVEAQGLGLLSHETVFGRSKLTRQVRAALRVGHGPFSRLAGLRAAGYEIRVGTSTSGSLPFAEVEAEGSAHPDGGCDDAGLVLGTHLHGILHEPAVREALLSGVATLAGRSLPAPGTEVSLDEALDRWTHHIATHVDLPRIAEWVDLA